MTTAFGRPVEGEISRYSNAPAEQDDPALFIEALDELLATPGVRSVVWEQYTPYFNDGDVCEFSTRDARIEVESAEDEDGEYGDGTLTEYDMYDYADGGYRDKKFRQFGEISGEVYFDALRKFNRVAMNGSHEVVLQEKFGDPAQVTATKNGFVVEHYDHD